MWKRYFYDGMEDFPPFTLSYKSTKIIAVVVK